MTLFPRSSGVLLHPTSLPGRYGIGDLGEYAYRFVDWLNDSGQTVWQVLPLGPTSYGDSPYQCLSAFAGNTNLISLDKLVVDGWLTNDDLEDVPDFPANRVDYGPVIDYHNKKLHLAYERFRDSATEQQCSLFALWSSDNGYWLDDWSLFFAIKNDHGGRPWVEWESGLRQREQEALKDAHERLNSEIKKHRFLQWVFYSQWGDLKKYAGERGIRLVGDIPIFAAHDSCDVWSNSESFYLDDNGNPTVVAGVPPDYFSATGQRWGNPLYRWDVMEKNGYRWWIDRFRAILHLVDLVRIDHFRGFEAYWEIPSSEETAVVGQWIKGPNRGFFDVLGGVLGELPIIAEDLGEITKEVIELRDSLGLPGMKILQFAWSDPKNLFLPHNHIENCIVYSGTHDNNTTVGWWNNELDDNARQFVSQYLDCEVKDIAWAFIRLGMQSVAHTFVAPMQDIFTLGPEGRMNTPGVEGGNWGWRITIDMLNDDGVKGHLGHVTWLYQRRADQREVQYGDAATQ